ncbi:MAG: hypothetical protein DWQ05_17830 [Calditrichaeota bacterium]|nr:MAG: hypothetical protein DWQ05_17830 [Calditrichota bacterium]
MAKSKIMLGVVFIVLLAFLGFVLGTFIGKMNVPAGSGLAGPAIALSYGAAGFVLALVLGILLTGKLNHARLRIFVICLSCFAFLVIIFFAYRIIMLDQSNENAMQSKPPESTALPQN